MYQTPKDTADAGVLSDYVAALPDAERIAYYYANPTFTLYGAPAYIVHEAAELARAGDADAAQAHLAADYYARRDVRLAAERAINAPPIGDRIAGAVWGASGPGLFGFMGSLAAGALGAGHAAPAILTLTAALSAFGALCGFITGGRA